MNITNLNFLGDQWHWQQVTGQLISPWSVSHESISFFYSWLITFPVIKYHNLSGPKGHGMV